MADRRLFDISQPLHPALPAWPGDTPFSTEPVWRFGPDCPVNVSRFGGSTHAGTHADAPLHYDPRGTAIDALPLEPFLGPARVIDLRDNEAVIRPEQVRPLLEHGVERVLFRTYDRFPHARWSDDFITLAADTVRMLAAHGVVLVGIDSPSIDPRASRTLDAHQAVRQAGLRVLEGLVLDGVEAGDYELIALPLRLAGLDAAPVRAVLRTLP